MSVPNLGMIVPNPGTALPYMATVIAIVVACMASGCAPAPVKPARVVERVVYVPIPAELTAPLPVYERATETFGEAWQQAERNTRMLERANADRAAVQAIQGSKRDPGG